MAELGLKMVGLGTDGNAKAIRSDVYGNLGLNMQNRKILMLNDLTKMTIPTYDGSNQAVHPAVKYIPGGFAGYQFWMAMTPYPNSNARYENPSILCSEDGVTWSVPAGLTNPLEGPPVSANDWYADPELVYAPDVEGGTMYVYWSHFGSVSKMYRRSSTDGVTWTPKEECSKAFKAFGIVRKRASEWILYTTISSNGGHQIRISTSSDGITWSTDDLYFPLFDGVTVDATALHLSVLYDKYNYHFLLGAGGDDTNGNGKLIYGHSFDGKQIDWQQTPILYPSRTNAAFNQIIYRSCFVQIQDNQHRIYVSGRNSANEWSIGYVDCVIGDEKQDVCNRHLGMYSNVTLPNGGTKTIFSGAVPKGITRIVVHVLPAATHVYKVQADENNNRPTFHYRYPDIIAEASQGYKMGEYAVKVSNLSIVLKNGSGADATYTAVEVLGYTS